MYCSLKYDLCILKYPRFAEQVKLGRIITNIIRAHFKPTNNSRVMGNFIRIYIKRITGVHILNDQSVRPVYGTI